MLAKSVAGASDALRVVETQEEYTMAVKVLARAARQELEGGNYEEARDAAIALTELRQTVEIREMHVAFCEVCRLQADLRDTIIALASFVV